MRVSVTQFQYAGGPCHERNKPDDQTIFSKGNKIAILLFLDNIIINSVNTFKAPPFQGLVDNKVNVQINFLWGSSKSV